MSILRPIKRRRNRKAKRQQRAIDDAYAAEDKRIKGERRRVQQEEVFQSREGEGIAESANISLGFAEEEEEEEFGGFTGLVI